MRPATVFRKLAPAAALLALALAPHRASASGGGSPEVTITISPYNLDANGYVLFQPPNTPPLTSVNNIPAGAAGYTAMVQFTNNNTTTSFQDHIQANLAVTVTDALGNANPPGAPVATLPQGPAFFSSLQQSVSVDATTAAPGTYYLLFSATDTNPNSGWAQPSLSSLYPFVVSTAAGTLKGGIQASTMMTLNVSVRQTIYSGIAAVSSITDSTAGATGFSCTGCLMLLLNNVGTTQLLISDGYNSVVLEPGDVTSAAFARSGTTVVSVIDGTAGVLRVGFPGQ